MNKFWKKAALVGGIIGAGVCGVAIGVMLGQQARDAVYLPIIDNIYSLAGAPYDNHTGRVPGFSIRFLKAAENCSSTEKEMFDFGCDTVCTIVCGLKRKE